MFDELAPLQRRYALAAVIIGAPLLALAVTLAAYYGLMRYGPAGYARPAFMAVVLGNAAAAAVGSGWGGLLTRGDVRTRAGNTLAAALAGFFLYWLLTAALLAEK